MDWKRLLNFTYRTLKFYNCLHDRNHFMLTKYLFSIFYIKQTVDKLAKINYFCFPKSLLLPGSTVIPWNMCYQFCKSRRYVILKILRELKLHRLKDWFNSKECLLKWNLYSKPFCWHLVDFQYFMHRLFQDFFQWNAHFCLVDIAIAKLLRDHP